MPDANFTVARFEAAQKASDEVFDLLGLAETEGVSTYWLFVALLAETHTPAQASALTEATRARAAELRRARRRHKRPAPAGDNPTGDTV